MTRIHQNMTEEEIEEVVERTYEVCVASHLPTTKEHLRKQILERIEQANRGANMTMGIAIAHQRVADEGPQWGHPEPVGFSPTKQPRPIPNFTRDEIERIARVVRNNGSFSLWEKVRDWLKAIDDWNAMEDYRIEGRIREPFSTRTEGKERRGR